MKRINGQKIVKVFFEHINYKGDVTSSVQIAEFLNMNWAKEFIRRCSDGNIDEYTRYRVEEV